MAEQFKAIRGMNDILPEQIWQWQYLEDQFKQCLSQYGYQEIRVPIVENTQLFKRTIGEVTDIVEKEMYTFTDLNGDSLTLRPEGTAGTTRASIEHSLLYNKQQRLWYHGPMFRHEKPQKGRYRQFYQFGVEAMGFHGVDIEIEIIAICKRLWDKLGIASALRLEINSIGNIEERLSYKQQLFDYFQKNYHLLDEDSKKRLHRNPLRILDSKNQDMQSLIASAPRLLDALSKESRQQFDDLCLGLENLGIVYHYNPVLVRGLDYYSHTVFEWVTDKLGAQATVCAGGRYDALIEHLGGSANAAVGFAMGEERLLLLMEALGKADTQTKTPEIVMISDSQAAGMVCIRIAEQIRTQFPDWQVLNNVSGGSFKSQFKKADKSGARWALIVGEEEMQTQSVSVKNLREKSEQIRVEQDKLTGFLETYTHN